MIDAEFRSEERFTRLSLAYECNEEKEKVIKVTEDIINKYDKKPDVHSSNISNGREVLVIEYHDDIDREAGAIFSEMMKALDIKKCD